MAHCTSTQCNQGRRPCKRAACGMSTFQPTYDVDGPHYPRRAIRIPSWALGLGLVALAFFVALAGVHFTGIPQ